MPAGLVILTALATGLPPADMADVVAARLQALDGLVVDLTLEVYGAHSDTPVLDPAAWDTLWDTLPFRVTILRPNVRVEALKDEPERGYEPVVACIFDGTYTSRHVRPSRRSGRVFYQTLPDVQSGIVRCHPLLQVFDLGIFDAAPPGHLNIVTVLQHPSAILVRSVGGVSTYAASVPMGRFESTIHFEMDINERGTPLRIKTTLDNDHPDLVNSYYEQFALRTTEVNGAELPVETAVTHWGPKFPHYWTVNLYRVEAVEVRADLSPDDLRIEIVRRDSCVNEHFPDASVHQTEYDEDGRLVWEDRWFSAADSDTGDAEAIKAKHAIRWRMTIPPVAGLIGLSMAGLLTYRSRHNSH